MCLIFLFFSCSYKEYESTRYEAPNWTSDNKIVFVEVYWYQKYRKTIIGSELVENKEIGYLWEVDINQNYRKICKLWESRYNIGATNTSSAGEWVVIGYGNGEIWLVKRDGTNLHKLTNGKYPDFSPDASKIVFVRDDGLYVINRDGSGERRIVWDSLANYPKWSKDGLKIGYMISFYNLYPYLVSYSIIIDTSGNPMDTLRANLDIYDWGPDTTTLLLCWDWKIDKSIILDLNDKSEDTLSFNASAWSPNGEFYLSGMSLLDRNGNLIFKIQP